MSSLMVNADFLSPSILTDFKKTGWHSVTAKIFKDPLGIRPSLRNSDDPFFPLCLIGLNSCVIPLRHLVEKWCTTYIPETCILGDWRKLSHNEDFLLGWIVGLLNTYLFAISSFIGLLAWILEQLSPFLLFFFDYLRSIDFAWALILVLLLKKMNRPESGTIFSTVCYAFSLLA